jgi:hypothetical protein
MEILPGSGVTWDFKAHITLTFERLPREKFASQPT